MAFMSAIDVDLGKPLRPETPNIPGIGCYARFQDKCSLTVRWAQYGMLLKLRLAYKIPYHEWADALARSGFVLTPDGMPVFRFEDGPVQQLIAAYTPRWSAQHGAINGPRCAPWATRRYRDR